MPESKGLITTNGFMYKIKTFFKKLFGTKKEEILEAKEVTSNENNSFKEEISVKETSEEKRIIELQEKYRQGKIKATEISSVDIKKIVKLYNAQIGEMKDKIEYNKRMTERYKEEILKMKKEA